MKASTLLREIKKRGGQATIKTEIIRNDFGTREHVSLAGVLNGYDVEMIGDESSFFTARRVEKRGYYDPSSDYNSGDYQFFHRVKDLSIFS